MRCIAVANQKGGVGKTTTAVNLAACLARSGRRTLLIDFDHQANASDHLGVPSPENERESAYGLLLDRKPELKHIERIINPIGPNFCLAPGHIALAEADRELQSELAREMRLANSLSVVADRFDYVLIDSSPSVGIATINALCAAQYALITVQTNAFSFSAVKRLVRIIVDVKETINQGLVFYALPTMHRSNVIINKDVLVKVQEFFEDLAFKSSIRYTATLSEAAAAHQSIVDYAHGSKAHQDHEAVMEELISRVERTSGQAAEEEETA